MSVEGRRDRRPPGGPRTSQTHGVHREACTHTAPSRCYVITESPFFLFLKKSEQEKKNYCSSFPLKKGGLICFPRRNSFHDVTARPGL